MVLRFAPIVMLFVASLLPVSAQPIIDPPVSTAVVGYSQSGADFTITFNGPGALSGPAAFTLINDAGTNSGTSYNASSVTVVGTFSLDQMETAAVQVALFGATDGVAGSAPGASINAGNIDLTNNATISFSQAVGLRPGSSGALIAGSLGANGFADSTQNPVLSIFDGGHGGAVQIQHNGTITLTGSGAFDSSSDLAQFPLLSGIVALSQGGNGNDIQAHDTPQAGDGGDGGNVQVSTSANSAITATNSEPEIVTTAIYAASIGGAAGFNGGDGDTSATGLAGNAGSVSVDHSGTISNSAPSGIGILAESIGGSSAQGGEDNDNEGSGNGGQVSVTLRSPSSIQMTGNSGIGVFAASAAGSSNVQPNLDLQDEHGGDVGVLVEKGATISTGTGSSSRNSIGILAISSGSASVLNPFIPLDLKATGSGSSGDVLVVNQGNINTQGEMAIGIAALSIGGAGVVTTANGGEVQYLGNNGQVYGTQTGNVAVTSLGQITTLGATGHGIVAISSSGGGLLNVDVEPVNDGESWTQGVAVGANSSGNANGNNGGNVLVELGAINKAGDILQTGIINTGDGNGAGVASIGVVAQSIGGSGGTTAGSQPAFLLGDSGGSGGNGGNVTVDLLSASINTNDKNSLGVLAQSIGGGGGNGANAAGIFVAVGGNGGNGGNAGGVTANLFNGGIRTSADFSHGLVAQSIGGGGGHGGYADSAGAFLSASIGGTGGSGGVGGNINITTGQSTAITTSANQSIGIVAQSVGGGGGTGGAATAYAVGIGFSATMAIGGAGGDGGDTGQVHLTNNSAITTGIKAAPGAAGPNFSGADSHGILAQSIGGGGGHGGAATARSFSFPVDGLPLGGSFSLSLGASGGSAGGGNYVEVDNMASITTYSDSSHGILAQSIGGGGGAGGDSTASASLIESGAYTGKIALGAGGDGGNGGSGGGVVTNNGQINSDGSVTAGKIVTEGQYSTGILAQSIGGGGGAAGTGSASAGSPNIGGGDDDSESWNITFSIGGRGGDASNGAVVIVNNTSGSSILTSGSGSEGIVAQSIGGGGGKGGGGSSDSSGDNSEFNLSVGGGGGGGGDGGAVTVTNNGTISTQGGDAIGIHAQSIGGGGGSGGSSDASAANTLLSQAGYRYLTAPADSYSADASIGGKGGTAGYGGTVTVSNSPGGTGDLGIATAGVRAFGILAQSVGGGGGSGGEATTSSNSALDNQNQKEEQGTYEMNFQMGGSGGAAGNGGTVNVTNDGPIRTGGFSAHGILAHSIGGGGGSGGSGTVDNRSTVGLGASVSGGQGASGDGGTVTITATGGIVTTGEDASAIVAQSIGGGGGHYSAGNPVFFAQAPLLSPGADVNLGFAEASADSGGKGGPVGITLQSKITTTGDWAHGVLAQSIGAGGGKAGITFSTAATPKNAFSLGSAQGSGDGGDVTVTLQSGASISTGATEAESTPAGTTGGYGAYGILLQSVGGGGGIVTDGTDHTGSDQIQLGADSSVTGNGGNVTLNIDDSTTISTLGDTAHAIFLQSVGGGGGIVATGSSIGSSSGTANIGVGGLGSFSGAGGVVEIEGSAPIVISTSGDHAYGILAQSIGGSGGLAAAPNGDVYRVGSDNSAEINNSGIINISLASGSRISTSGMGSHALVAQSVAGGGGIANYPTGTPSMSVGNLGGPASIGFGDLIILNIDADIITSGDFAYGILAQSVAGGGGMVGSGGSVRAGAVGAEGSLGAGGEILITQSGSIIAQGENSAGIFAQSTGPMLSDPISITVNGRVQGGTGSQGYGIWVDGGSDNMLTINSGGTVTSTAGQAIRYTGGSALTVKNYGLVAGSVDLQEGQFMNFGSYSPVASIVSASRARRDKAGSGARFTTAEINADFIQPSRGEIVLRADFAAERADKLIIRGDAILGGHVRVITSSVLPFARIPVIVVEGTLRRHPDGNIDEAESTLFDYGLSRRGKVLSLGATKAHFAPDGIPLSRVERQVARHLNSIWNAGGNPTFGRLFSLLDQVATADPDLYADFLDQLSPGVSFGIAARRAADMQAFGSTALQSGHLEEVSGSWARTRGQTARQDDGSGMPFRINSTVTEIGAQTEIADGWFLGGALAYEYQWINAENGFSSGSGHNALAALFAKHQTGPWLFSGMLHGSLGFYETERTIGIPGFGGKAQGNPDVQSLGFLAQAAWTWEYEQFYLRPSLTLNTIYIRGSSFKESGAGPINLEVAAADQVTFIATPAVEFGGTMPLNGQLAIKTYAKAGINFLSNDEWRQSVRLAGAPAGADAFDARAGIDNIVGRVAVGAELVTKGPLRFSIQYEGEYSESLVGHGGSIAVGWDF